MEAPLAIRHSRMEKRGQLVTPEDDDHSAETELDGFTFDRLIDNSEEDLDALYVKIDGALR